MTAKEPERIWTGTFVLLCITEFLSYGHHTVLTPTLPLYVTHLGGTPITVGVILAVFCASSVLLRPTIGYWADTWSYSGILSLGTCLLGFSVLLYLFPLIGMLILSNALRGIGWAGLNTAAYSILADCAPHKRRGEASGYFTSFQSCAVVLFPALALWLIEARGGSFNVVIVLSSALAFTGSGIALFLKPPSVGSTSKTCPSTARRQSASFTIVDRNVLVATIMLFCICLPLPATTSFIVLYARDIGIQGIGWYFVASGLTHVLTRPLLGRVSDRIGRGLSIASAYGLELCGLLLLSAAPNLAVLSLGGVFFAAGTAMGTSSTTAMAISLADPKNRGMSMATFSVAYPLSVGLGAILTGTVIEIAGFRWMFIAALTTWALGFSVMVLYWSSLDRTTDSKV